MSDPYDFIPWYIRFYDWIGEFIWMVIKPMGCLLSMIIVGFAAYLMLAASWTIVFGR